MSDERDMRDDAQEPSRDMTPDFSPDTPNAADTLFAQYDIAGFVLGALSDDEAADLRETAARNPQLADAIAEMEVLVSGLAFAAPHTAINRGRSAGIRSRLVSKAVSTREKPPVSRRTAEIVRPFKPRAAQGQAPAAPANTSNAPEPRSAPATTTTQSERKTYQPQSVNVGQPLSAAERSRGRWGWTVAGLLAASLVVAVAGEEWRMSQQRGQDSHAAERAELLATRLDSLQGVVSAKDSLVASLTGPSMQVVDLVNYQSLDPLARMFWDQKTQEWTLYAYHLRQPKPGKTYQVWLITKTNPAPISAGTFAPNPDGSATLRAKYGLDKNALVKVAVSEEPTGGVPSPTGPIIIAGAGK